MQLDEITLKRQPLNLSHPQASVYYARTPLVLDMAGQGAGKTENIGVQSGDMINRFPKAIGFIAANTYLQLSQTTLKKAMDTWRKYYGWDEYDKNDNPSGFYVIDKKPPAHFRKFTRLRKYNNTISFKNGALLFTGSLDNYLAHDGKEFAWAHLDETKDTKKEAVTQVILSRLRQAGLYYREETDDLYWIDDKKEAKKQGLTAYNPCCIHTTPALGGVDWIIDLFGLARLEPVISKTLANPDDYFYYVRKNVTVVIYQTYWNEANLPENYITNARLRLTDEEQKIFIEGNPFTKTGNEYFPEFQRSKHVFDNIRLDFTKRMHVMYDFNVMPYITQIVAQIDNVIKFYNKSTGEKVEFLEGGEVGFEAINVMRIKICRELCKKPPENETEQACDALGLWLKENEFSGDIAVYGDASGHSRITGLASLTQYKIIKRILSKYFANDVLAKKANISVLQRKKLMNRIFAGKFPEIEIYIDSSCILSIRDFEFLKQDVNGKFKEKEIDKATGKAYEKIGHTSDAIEYFICEVLRNYLKFID